MGGASGILKPEDACGSTCSTCLPWHSSPQHASSFSTCWHWSLFLFHCHSPYLNPPTAYAYAPQTAYRIRIRIPQMAYTPHTPHPHAYATPTRIRHTSYPHLVRRFSSLYVCDRRPLSSIAVSLFYSISRSLHRRAHANLPCAPTHDAH